MTKGERADLRRLRIWSILIGIAVFAVDTVSKSLVQKTAWLHYYPLINGLLTIRYAQNEGIAFGMLHDLQSAWKAPVLGGMAILALAMVSYYLWTTPPSEKLMFLSLGLLMGGILGNFVDRVLHSYVIDFIKVHWGSQLAWPTFNVADAAITSGVILILLATLLGGLGQSRHNEADASHSEG